jgi:hypothetical protein
MPRFELPPDLSPEEQRAVLAALEEALGHGRARLSPWALAGRIEALGLGALQARRETDVPWRSRGHAPFARRGTPRLLGRGDAK